MRSLPEGEQSAALSNTRAQIRGHVLRALACLALGVGLPTRALAGNDEGFLLGNQALLSGGAVTATIDEGSAIWYNPAGLAAVTSPSLDLSANAYGLRFYHAPGFLTAANGSAATLDVVELIVVPTALSIVRPLNGRVRLGLGVFVPRANDLVLRGDLDAGSDGRWLVSLAEYDRLTYAGGSLGWAVTPTLRLGFALLGVYEYEQSSLQVAGGRPSDADADADADAVSFVSTGAVSTRASFGAMLSFGGQWELWKQWRLGLSVRSPSYNVYSNSANSGFTTSAVSIGGFTSTSFFPQAERSSRSTFSQTTPVQLRAGFAWVGARSSVALDGDVQPGLRSRDGDRKEARFNVRVGAQYQLAPRLSFGGGLFTDRDTEPDDSSGSGPLHFYGGSAGVRWGRLYQVDGEERRSFDFTTTLGLRYAFARGKHAALGVRAVDQPLPPVTTRPGDAIVHEIMVHIGSGFYF